jgi:hypothetical protein
MKLGLGFEFRGGHKFEKYNILKCKTVKRVICGALLLWASRNMPQTTPFTMHENHADSVGRNKGSGVLSYFDGKGPMPTNDA